MGLLFDVLGAPVSLPVRGFMFIFDKIVEQVNNELLDDGKVRMQLLELQGLLDSGQISEEEFYDAEEELLDRLDAILAFKEVQMGMAEDDDWQDNSLEAGVDDDEGVTSDER